MNSLSLIASAQFMIFCFGMERLLEEDIGLEISNLHFAHKRLGILHGGNCILAAVFNGFEKFPNVAG